VLVGGAAACGDDHPGDLPPPASSPPGGASETPGLELTPAEQEAVEEARAKFDEFMNAYIEVSTAELPTAEDSEEVFARLDQHVGGGELSQELRIEIVGRWGNGQLLEGALKWDLVDILDVNLDREVDGRKSPQVDLQYCIDAAEWIPVDANTGQPVGPNGDRHLWFVAAVWSDDWFGQSIEGWRVREREQLEDPC
jgi:hypothetical protein